jgi:glutamine cyclotransferase
MHSDTHRAASVLRRFLALVAGTIAVAVLQPSATPADDDAPALLSWSVVDRYPHDRSAFTQGLLVHGGDLYESTGLRGRSSVRVVDIKRGTIRKRVDLPRELFGEGLALVGDRLVQLTWTSGTARVYSLPGLELVGEHRYSGEGWGLCYDGRHLVMSDGSQRLTVRDPESFEVLRTVEVTENGRPATHLNELECVGGKVYANVWRTWKIVRIDPASGRVDAWLDASNLLSVMEKQALPAEAVLNGIAYDESTDTFLLTGKLWPRIHRIRLTAPN